MTEHDASSTRGSAPESTEEERLLDLLEQSYRPDPMDFERRSDFDRSLRARLERPSRRAVMAGPALAALAALALFWHGGLLGERTRLEPRPDRVETTEGVVATPAGDRPAGSLDWTGEVLDALEGLDGLYADDSEMLPDDYLAIASVLLGREV